MEKACAMCGIIFERRHKQIYCSEACVQKARWMKDHPAHKEDGLYHGTCMHCGERFVSERKRKFCSNECLSNHTSVTAREKRGIGTCKRCGKELPVHRQVFCSDECKIRYKYPKPYTPINDDEMWTRISERYPTLEYVRGYVGYGSNITLRCKVCGKEFEWLERAARRKYASGCPHCNKQERKRKEDEERIIAEVRTRATVINRLVKDAREKQRRLRECIICGARFEPWHHSSCCSDECTRKFRRESERNNKHARRVRIQTAADKITLRNVFDKDKGVCYICGETCRYDDKEIKNGHFIAGDRYPSIDHVMPLSKGGTHTHDNVRLACKLCNSKKSDKILLGGVKISTGIDLRTDALQSC